MRLVGTVARVRVGITTPNNRLPMSGSLVQFRAQLITQLCDQFRFAVKCCWRVLKQRDPPASLLANGN